MARASFPARTEFAGYKDVDADAKLRFEEGLVQRIEAGHRSQNLVSFGTKVVGHQLKHVRLAIDQ
jgi:hypothetical protein